jgi:hypothetical protein
LPAIFSKSGSGGDTGWYLCGDNWNRSTDVSLYGRVGDGVARQAGAVGFSDFTWIFGAMSFTPSDGGPRLFLGSLTQAVREPAYFSRSEQTTYTSDASASAIIGNTLATGGRTWNGSIAMVALFDNLLRLDQWELIRRFPQQRGQLFPLDMLSFFQTAGGTRINCKGLWLMDM